MCKTCSAAGIILFNILFLITYLYLKKNILSLIVLLERNKSSKTFKKGGTARNIEVLLVVFLFSNVEFLQPFVGRELFAAGFVSCWSQLNEASQRQLVRSLEMAFSSPNIPPEILATLLNLVSFSCILRETAAP